MGKSYKTRKRRKFKKFKKRTFKKKLNRYKRKVKRRNFTRNVKNVIMKTVESKYILNEINKINLAGGSVEPPVDDIGYMLGLYYKKPESLDTNLQ